MSVRTLPYENELGRVFKKLSEMDPATEGYGKLLGRAKFLEDLIGACEQREVNTKLKDYEFALKRDRATFEDNQAAAKAAFDEEMRLKEFDLKASKEEFDEQAKRWEFDLKDMQAERQANVDETRLKNDITKEVISAGRDLTAKLIGGGLAFAGTYIATKATIAIGAGMLSDEASGKLVMSSLRGILPKPNLFNMIKI